MAAQRAIDADRLARQDEQLSEYESEIALLRRRLDTMENDRVKDKKEIARLQETLNRTRIVSQLSTSSLVLNPIPTKRTLV